ncbi:TPA: type II toxin-antitoxin system HigA family antitoxin, partial [Klebsiella pneumoniae]
MISDANKAVNDLASIVPLLGGSSSRKDYEDVRKLVEYLLEHDPDSPLVDILTARIDAWENNAVEFTRIEAGKNGVSLLRVLLQQRGLSQSDFENEIGKKSGTVAKLAMRQPFVLFKGLTFQKLCLPGA